MKRKNHLYQKICDIGTIMEIYDKSIRKNTKNKKKIQRFEHFYSCHMAKIKETLVRKSYTPGKYHIFLIHEPKARIIMSQEIEDKIVNHLVAKYFLIDVFEPSLSDRNCATRVGKGTHYALRLFKQDYHHFLNQYGTFYILKLDISKYFYNLDHDIIKKLVRRKIKDKDVLQIVDLIVDSTDEAYVNRTITKLKEGEKERILKSNMSEKEKERKRKEIDSLPLYTKGKGVCIGNMVSQIVATFYLDEVDRFVQEKLKIKAYARYMDDFYCMHEDKQYLKECLQEIKALIEKYQLCLNEKTKIYSSKEDVEFLGFMFSSKHHNIRMKLTNKTKKNFKKKMKNKGRALVNEEISTSEYLQVRNSYRGHLAYGNCYYLYHKYVIPEKEMGKRE